MSAAKKIIKLKLIRSLNRRTKYQKACVYGLGLKRIHQSVEVIDTPENRGMINKVAFMLEVEE